MDFWRALAVSRLRDLLRAAFAEEGAASGPEEWEKMLLSVAVKVVDAIKPDVVQAVALERPPLRLAEGVSFGPEAQDNRFLVGVAGLQVVVATLGLSLNREDAQNLGVNLCALAFDSAEEAAQAITAALGS